MAGNDQYTTILLHMDGGTGDANFINEGVAGTMSFTRAGSPLPVNSPANAKFGSAGGKFVGTGELVGTNGLADITFGTGDFTIDTWFKFDSNFLPEEDRFYLYRGISAYPHAEWYIYGYDNKLWLEWDYATYEMSSSGDAAPNTWYHAAVVRNGTTIKMFLNGNVKGSVTIGTDSMNIPTRMEIGCSVDTLTANVFLDEYRVSKGIARWTDTFPPPTSAYTTVVEVDIVGRINFNIVVEAIQEYNRIAGNLDIAGSLSATIGNMASITGYLNIHGALSELLQNIASISGYVAYLGKLQSVLCSIGAIRGNIDYYGEPIRTLVSAIGFISGTFQYQSGIEAITELLRIAQSGIALNATNFAVTEYTNFGFNSFAVLDGKYYGANEHGIYLLGGSTQDGKPIQSEIQSGSIDMWVRTKQIPRQAWITGRNAGSLIFTVEDEEGVVHEYDMKDIATDLHEMRVKFGRGVKGRFFKYGLKNKAGMDFDIDSIRVMAELIKNKKR